MTDPPITVLLQAPPFLPGEEKGKNPSRTEEKVPMDVLLGPTF